jgi:hypothetical protein
MITPVTIAANNPIVALENRYEKVTAEKALPSIMASIATFMMPA